MSRGIIRGKPATNSIRGKPATDASTARTLANPASSLAITIDLQRLTGRIYLSPNQASKKATPSPDKSGGLNGSTQHSPKVLSAGVSMANSFTSVDSKKTLPCLGFIEYSPKDQVSSKSTIGSTD